MEVAYEFKKLNIPQKSLIISECWTFYKMLVMQNIKYFDTWLASHTHLCVNKDGTAYFREKGDMDPLSYFCDILEIKEQSMDSISDTDLVDFIKKQIDDEYYIIIDLDFNILYNRGKKGRDS